MKTKQAIEKLCAGILDNGRVLDVCKPASLGICLMLFCYEKRMDTGITSFCEKHQPSEE